MQAPESKAIVFVNRFARKKTPLHLYFIRERRVRFSCQVSWNSVQRWQRRSPKCLCQSESSASIFVDRSAPRNKHNFIRERWVLPSSLVKLRLVVTTWEVKNVSANRARAAIFVDGSAQKTNIYWKTLSACLLSSCVKFRLIVTEEK